MSQVGAHYMDVDMNDPEFFTFANTIRYYGTLLLLFIYLFTFFNMSV